MKPERYTPSTPLHMVWISTNLCNARCLHCSSNSSCRSPDELNTREVYELLDAFAEAGVVDLAVSGGEPLLRRDLFELLGYAQRTGLRVGIGSNGGRLTPTQAERLVEVGVHRIQFSLDGFERSHDTVRQWPGLFLRVLGSIKTAKSAGLRVHVCCTISRLNEGDLERFGEFIAGLGVARLNLSRYVPTGRGTEFLDLPDESWRGVIQRMAHMRRDLAGRVEMVGHHAQEVLFEPELAKIASFNGCQAGITQGCVTANGTVYPCVLLPIPIGNVRTKPFAEIWQDSEVVAQLRARDELKGACGLCEWKRTCGGCRAVAFARTGDAFASDPRCWIDRRQALTKEVV